MFILVLLSLVYPINEVAAAVSISEVAWMGSVESANFEWIELVNESTTGVSVAGWTLSDGMNLVIPLSGTIPGETYVLLERNRSDERYLQSPPFVTYSGALVNTGATLTLRDSSGMIIDQVVGGENWEQIGGDNTTKETAQYTDTGWVTAPATPGQPNALTGRTPGTAVASQSTASGGSNNSAVAKKADALPAPTITQGNTTEALVLTPDVPAIAYVGQTVAFSVTPSGLSNSTIMNSLQYRWNFGDSYARGGKTVEHVYRYPGEYVVSVEGEFANRRQQARTTITVLPVQLSITRSEVGDIQLHNNAPYEISLDGYQVSGVSTIVMPAETTLLPRATITIARHRLDASPSTPVIVYDAHGRVMTSTLTPARAQAEPERLPATPVAATQNLGSESVRFIPVAEASDAGDMVLTTPDTPAVTEAPVVVPVAAQPAPQLPERAFIGLVGILLVSIIALYLIKPRQRVLG